MHDNLMEDATGPSYASMAIIPHLRNVCSELICRRGVGFVNFAEPDAAARAQRMLHGAHLSEDRFLHIAMQVQLAMLVLKETAHGACSCRGWGCG
jgi:hypothetical protein